ncbi:MAG: sulfatase [Terriglobales bacterium]|jgi:arylsulfatase A-like enzyme
MKPRSLVLVTVDCLRADHVGFLGYSRPVTPFLDSLAAESFVVPNAIVGGVPTYYSFPAILASRYPLAMGRDLVGLVPDEVSLPSYLKQSGYMTASFVAANPYVSRKFGYGQAFDTFCDFLDQEMAAEATFYSKQSRTFRAVLNRSIERLSRNLGPVGTLYDELYFRYCQLAGPSVQSLDSLRPFPSADAIVDRALEWVGSVCPSPFFLWLHLMDPHAPYYPAEEALRAIGATAVSPSRARYLNSYWNRRDLGSNRLRSLRDAVIELYDGSIRWVDMQMARLVDTLKGLQVWDQSALVFTADHGEEFLEHGARFHGPWTMKEELIRVPLLVRVPGVFGREVSKKPFSHLDLAPTLLHALDLAVPREFQGRSDWGEWNRREGWERPAVVESTECINPDQPEDRLASRVLCIRDSRYKLILRFGCGQEQLFDLHSDPSEMAPLPADIEKPVRRRLLEYARRHIEGAQRIDSRKHRLRARSRELRIVLSKSAPAD